MVGAPGGPMVPREGNVTDRASRTLSLRPRTWSLSAQGWLAWP